MMSRDSNWAFKQLAVFQLLYLIVFTIEYSGCRQVTNGGNKNKFLWALPLGQICSFVTWAQHTDTAEIHKMHVLCVVLCPITEGKCYPVIKVKGSV